MRLIPTFASVIIVAASAAFAAQNDAPSKKFLSEAIEGNYAEVQMGELAQKNARSADVKSFGQMLITDHGAANRKAIEVTRRMNATAPGGPNAKQKANHAKMSKMNDDHFDTEFIQHMVADHKKDIAAYTKQSKINDDAGRYAQETLPTLQKHLDTALDVQKK